MRQNINQIDWEQDQQLDHIKIQTIPQPNITGVRPGTGSYKFETTHTPNIAGVKPGTRHYKRSDNAYTKYNGSKTTNWTQQNLRQHINQIDKEQDQELDQIKVQTIHQPNITGVRPGTGTYNI